MLTVTSYPANGKLLSKSRDPRIPTISCSIGKTDIHNALCDLGEGVSVMPYSLYKRLGLGEYSPTTITLQMEWPYCSPVRYFQNDL